MKVGFIGLGDQGAPIAQAIAEAMGGVTLWARNPRTVEQLGGCFDHDVADSLPDLASRVDLLGVCVARDADVEELLVERELLALMKPGSIIANHGTGSPEAARRFAMLGRRRAIDVLDAPVSGGGAGARARTLTAMVGGDAAAFARARPVFETFASTIKHLGRPGSGQLAKLVNNALLATNMYCAEQMLDLAARMGLEPHPLIEVILASSGRSMALQQLGTTETDLLLHFQTMLTKDIDEFALAVARSGAADRVSPIARAGVEGIGGTCELLREQSSAAEPAR